MDESVARWIVGLYVAGFALPVGAAFVGYWRLTARHRRNETIRAFRRGLDAWHAKAYAALQERGWTVEDALAIQQEHKQRTLDAGMPFVTSGEFSADIGLPPTGEVAAAIQEARVELGIVGVGLLCSTIASIWATLASVG